MLNIKKVTPENLELVKTFLKTVPSIGDVEDSIVKNAIIAEQSNSIFGVVSYEKYDAKALIRYFVFKKALDISVVRELFEKLIQSAVLDNINKLYCVVNSQEVKDLFESLGFEEIENKSIYIDEEPFIGANLNDAIIMEYEPIIKC